MVPDPLPSETAPPADRPLASPWLTIWTSPRAAMRWLLDHEAEYTFQTYGIAVAYGVVTVASGDFERFFGTAVPLLLKVGLALSVGPILGLAGVFVGGFLASAVGRMLGGTGSVEDLRPALAWGALPVTVAGACTLPVALLLMPRLRPYLASDRPLPPSLILPSLAVLLGSLLVTAGWAWSLVTTTKCVAEAHGFSAWRALAIPVIAAVAGATLAVLLSSVFR